MKGPSAASGTTSSHFHWLDLLRFTSAFTVLVAHARGASIIEFANLPASDRTYLVAVGYAVTRLGNEAVVAFLVLSGFLVGGKAFERMMTGSFQRKDYVVDRVVRIALPLIPALVFTAFIRYVIDGSLNGSQFACNLASLQGVVCRQYGGNLPLWSLPYEVWCYVLVWGIGCYCTRRPFLGILAIIMAGAVLAHLDFEYVACWFLGVAGYLCRPRTVDRRLLLLAINCVVVGTGLTQFFTSASASSYSDLVVRCSRVLLGAAIAGLIQQVVLIPPKGVAARKIERWGVVVCSWSYTLYLVQFPLIELVDRLGLSRSSHVEWSFLLSFSIRLAASCAFAIAMYWLFERNTVAVKAIIRKGRFNRRVISSTTV